MSQNVRDKAIKAGSPALKVAGVVDLAIAYVAGIIAVTSTVVVFLSLLADVIARYATNASLGWPGETPNILFPWLIMGGIVLAAHRGGHIAVPLFLDAMSSKMARMTLLAMQVVVFATFTYLAWISIDVVKITRTQYFPITKIPQLYSYSALVFGFGCVAIIAIITFVRILHADDARTLNVDSGENQI
jgi:TRAP-type C4-dicarboxylate transport system permease small subunit